MLLRPFLFPSALMILILFQILPNVNSDTTNLLDVIQWKSIPNNCNLYLWIEKGNDVVVRRFIRLKGLSASVSLIRSNYFEDVPDFASHIDTRSWDSLSIIMVTNSSKIPLQMIEILKFRRRSRKPTIFLVKLKINLNFELSTLVNNLRLSLNNGRGNKSRNLLVSHRYSIDSRVYIVFVSSEEGGTVQSMSTRKIQVLEVYTVQNTTRLNVVAEMGGSVNFSTLIGRPARRKFDMESLAAVADDNELTDYYAAFDKTSDVLTFSSGTYVSIYRDLKTMLNFSEVALIGSPIGYTDDRLLGLSYDLLEAEEADLSIQIITITSQRAKWLSFLQPMSKGDGVWAFFLQPAMHTFRNIFLSPFQTSLWIALLCLYLGIILSITVLSVIKGRYASNEDVPKNDAYFKEDGYFWAIGALCQKGWHRTPSSPSLRIVFFMGCAVGVIAYAGYSASIVSVLSVKAVPVSSFEQLLGFNFEFYVHEFSTVVQNILESIIHIYHLKQKVHLTDTKSQVRQMRRSTSAFLSYPDIFYSSAHSLNESEKALCGEIHGLRIPISPGKSAMFLKKGSDLRNILNYRLLMIRERGLNERYWKKALERTVPKCLEETRADLQTLGIPDVFTAILALAVGAGFALCLLCVELNMKQLARRLRRNSYRLSG